MSNDNTYRICRLCDQPYPGGTYRAHAALHVPIRSGVSSTPRSDVWDRVAALLAEGLSQAEVGRRLGLSRQRVHQIANPEPSGRRYRATAMNAWQREHRSRGNAA